MKKSLYVTFFGEFTLSCSKLDKPAAAHGQSSRRVWTFLQYLCAFHQRGVSQEDIIEAVWGEAEVADPVGALKTILHRARMVLEGLQEGIQENAEKKPRKKRLLKKREESAGEKI